MKGKHGAVAFGVALALLSGAAAAYSDDFNVTLPNGDHFIGSRDGQGVYTYASGATYDGDFLHGVPHGQAVFQLANGDIYQGGFADGAAAGDGVYTFTNGTLFDGGFAAWVPEGTGALTLADGTRFEGTWSAGAAVSVTRVSGTGDLPSVTPCYFGLC